MTTPIDYIQEAIALATRHPSLIHHDEIGFPIFAKRVRENLDVSIKNGLLPAGRYVGHVMVGKRPIAIGITVQADLFGPTSAVLDTTELEKILAERS